MLIGTLCALQPAVDRRPGDGEYVREVADRVVAGAVHAAQLAVLFFGELGFLAAQLALGARDFHAFAGAHADQVGFKLGEGGQDVEEHLSHGVRGVVDRRTQGEADAAFGEV